MNISCRLDDNFVRVLTEKGKDIRVQTHRDMKRFER